MISNRNRVTAALAFLTCAALTLWFKSPSSPGKPQPDPARLVQAVQEFRDNAIRSSKPIPPSITLQDLHRGGFLSSAELSAYEGLTLTISMNVDPHKPGADIIRARMADGQELVLKSDGSVRGHPHQPATNRMN